MNKKKLSRIYVPGGVISHSRLSAICKALLDFNITVLSLGSRQDILVELSEQQVEQLKTNVDFDIIVRPYHQDYNIVTSYMSADIFDSFSWVKASTYVYLIESFDFVPTLKINITDPNQNLIPSYSGDINVVASEILDYWAIYLRYGDSRIPELYPVLVHSNDVNILCRHFTDCWGRFDSVEALFTKVSDVEDLDTRVIQHVPNYDVKIFPYYEGMHRYSIDIYWLGLYWRNNEYNVNFIIELCEQCQVQMISTICLTSWKSLIIRGIRKEYKVKWEKLLGVRGISVRHSQLEMNWHLPAGDTHAFQMKVAIVEDLNKMDISTYGLTIGIFDDINLAFTSIVLIRSTKGYTDALVDVYYADGFNPDHCKYELFAQNVGIRNIAAILVDLSQLYFNNYLDQDVTPVMVQEAKSLKEEFKGAYQCGECQNTYLHSSLGEQDELEVTFKNLPDTYQCSVCGAPKSAFSFNKIKMGTPLQVETFF